MVAQLRYSVTGSKDHRTATEQLLGNVTKNKIEPQKIRCSLIYNIDFGLSGVAVGGIEMSTMQKGCHFMEMSQHFCPSLFECKILLLHIC